MSEQERKPYARSTGSIPPIDEVKGIVSTTKQRRTLRQLLALIGPAFVVGAWQFGPGNLTTAVQAGSAYQYALIWMIIVSTTLMIFFADMSVRLGIKSPVSLVSSIKTHLGGGVGILAGIGVLLNTLMFSVGNAVGSGLGLSMLFGGQPAMWTVVCGVAIVALLLLKNVYRVLEKILVTTVALMAVSFVVSAYISNPDWGAAAAGIIPNIPEGSMLLIIAMVSTNFSVNGAFYTSYATKEHGRSDLDYRDVTLVDTIPGIVAPGVMTALVIIVSAAVLGHTGEAVGTIAGLAGVFEPLAGKVGVAIFALGFSGAAISSMIANVAAGGTVLSDALGRGPTASSSTARIVSIIILAFGVAITLAFQSSPVQLIVTAQALTIMVVPLLAILILLMSNRPTLMGDMRNKWWQNVFGLIGLAVVLILSGRLILSFVGG